MLENFPIQVSIPASDKGRAKRFYAEQLGLLPYSESGFGMYYISGGTKFAIIQSDSAGKADYSLMSWLVDDLDGLMSEMRGRGIEFEEYDEPFRKTVSGVFTIYSDRLAWFKDSEGNIITLAEIG